MVIELLPYQASLKIGHNRRSFNKIIFLLKNLYLIKIIVFQHRFKVWLIYHRLLSIKIIFVNVICFIKFY